MKQPVIVADFYWNSLLTLIRKNKIQFNDIPRFPAVERDLAIVIPKKLNYAQIETAIRNTKLKKLKKVSLFDVFESERGEGSVTLSAYSL